MKNREKPALTPEEALQRQEEKRKKRENFWFYHRWHVLIGGFLVAVVLVSSLQAAMITKPDVEGMLVLESNLQNLDHIAKLHAQLTASLTDQNGDGEVSFSLEELYIGGSPTQAQFMYEGKMRALFQTDTVKLVVIERTSFENKLSRFLETDPEFFADLDVTDDGYDPKTGIWDWYGSVYQQSEWGKTLPEHLYFAVLGPRPSAKEAELAAVDASKELLEEFIAAANEPLAETKGE